MKRVLVAFATLGFVPSLLAAQTVLVVITGIGGEDRYAERFHTWAATLMDAAGTRFHVCGLEAAVATAQTVGGWLLSDLRCARLGVALSHGSPPRSVARGSGSGYATDMA